jgi:hypothetical protein
MNVTLTINSSDSIKVGYSDLASIISCLPDDMLHAIFFKKLCGHPASEVRSALAGMRYMDPDMLEILAIDTSIEVVRQVAHNKRALKMFKTSLIQTMIERDVSIALVIADNIHLTLSEARPDIIQILLQHPDPEVVEKASGYDFSEESWNDNDDGNDED